jgi:hypothetical protein
MVAEELRGPAALVAALLAEELEEVRHLHGVVAGAGHDLRPHDVGLRLRVAAVLQEHRVHAEAADDVDDLRGAVGLAAAQDSAQHAEAAWVM